MAFGLFKNPFEALSADNQKAMVSNLEEIKNYFFKGNTIVDAVNNLGKLVQTNIKQQEKLISVLLKRQEKQMTDKDQKEMLKTASVFGPALQRIVGAIKDYGDLPEDAVDKFVMGIEKIAAAFVKMKDIGKTVKETAQGLMLMAGAIILFGLAIIIAFPIYLVAVLAAPLVLGVVLGFLYLFTEALGKKRGRDIKEGAQGLMFMAGAILLFGVAMVLAGIVYAQLWTGMAGMVAILLTIGAVMMLMRLLDGYDEVIEDGVRALALMVVVIFMTGIALFLAGLVYAQLWKGMVGMIAIVLTIGVLMMLMAALDGFSETILDGAKALLLMTAVVFIVGIALILSGMLYAELWNGLIGMVPILLVIGALVGLMALIDMMSDTIYDGAKALFVMVLALALTGIVLFYLNGKAEEMLQGGIAAIPVILVMAALVGIMFLISKLEKEVLKGSFALLVLSGAMLVLAKALEIYKKVYFDAEDAFTLVGTVAALAVIATLLGNPTTSVYSFIGAGALAVLGAALIPLAFALKKYKETQFTEDDAKLLGITVVALAGIGTLLGNPITSAFTFIGAAALGALGLALIGITHSLKTFKESGWKDSDNVLLADTLKSLVNTLVEIPTLDLAKAGYAAFALSGIGNMMTGLARGIQSFANMKFVEYEVKDGKIVPKSITKLDDTAIQQAGINFGKVVDAIAGPLGRLGDEEMSGTGLFSGQRVSRGIKALTGIGNIMSGLAKGVQDFANLTFTTYEVKDGKIVPVSVTKLEDTHIQGAGVNFGKVVDSILKPMSRVGEAEVKSSGWFTGGYISKGIKALTGVGNILTDLAKGVQAFANLTFTSYKVEDGKIVPDKIVTLQDGDFTKMEENVGKVINAFLNQVIIAGEKYRDNKKDINAFNKVMPDISKNLTALAENAKKWSEVDSAKASAEYQVFLTSVMDSFNRGDADLLLKRMSNFTSNAQILVNGSTKLEKVADSFERIAEAFGVMKDNINAMEIERLTQVTKLMGFLDSMAGGKGEDAVENVAESIKQGMEALKDVLEEIKTQLGAGGGAAGAPATANIGIGPGTAKAEPGAAAGEKKPAEQPKLDLTPVVTAINNLKNTLTTTGIKVQKGFPF
jgi:hypothetical protein